MIDPNPEHILQQFFGYPQFRLGQKEIVDSILAGHDTLALMPTGGGKSLCFQVPGLCLDGTTIVISPLIALMKDQVQVLQKKNISATFINSSLEEKEQNERFTFFTEGKYKFLYLAPERLLTEKFITAAQKVNIPLLAVDEAHCISEWGHDFRPEYTQITSFIQKLNKRPIIAAFTATATPRVQLEITHYLGMKSPSIFKQSFQRKNLFISIKKCMSENQKLVTLLRYLTHHKGQMGIIYCQTRETTEIISGILKKFGLESKYYHAGLNAEQRSVIQDDFLLDKIPLIVSTNAFGMGVDKSNIRFVIHIGIPRNIEGYYQEIGRAGRDGKASHCLLLFSSHDEEVWQKMNAKNKKRVQILQVKNVKTLMTTKKCFSQVIMNHFGQRNSLPCKNCSNCRTYKVKLTEQEADSLQEIQIIRKKWASKYKIQKERVFTSTQMQLLCLKDASIQAIPGIGQGWVNKFNIFYSSDSSSTESTSPKKAIATISSNSSNSDLVRLTKSRRLMISSYIGALCIIIKTN